MEIWKSTAICPISPEGQPCAEVRGTLWWSNNGIRPMSWLTKNQHKEGHYLRQKQSVDHGTPRWLPSSDFYCSNVQAGPHDRTAPLRNPQPCPVQDSLMSRPTSMTFDIIRLPSCVSGLGVCSLWFGNIHQPSSLICRGYPRSFASECEVVLFANSP